MNDSNKEQAAINTDRAKSIEAIQAIKSGGSLRPTTPAARKKRWPSLSLIALMLLLAIPVIIYLLQSEPVTGLEGLGVAFCAVAQGIPLRRMSPTGDIRPRASLEPDAVPFIRVNRLNP